MVKKQTFYNIVAMYSKKFLYNSFYNTSFSCHNLKNSSNVKNACVLDQNFLKCLCTFRTISLTEISNTMNNVITKLKFVWNSRPFYVALNHRLHSTSNKLKDQSTIIIRVWTRQCEYIVAQRFRRTHQMFCLYSKIWEERAFRELLARLKQQISRRSKEFIFGSVGLASFNWDKEKITNEEIKQHSRDFVYIYRLQEETLICKICHQRRKIDVVLPGIEYCKCGNVEKYTLDEWAPYLERKNLIIWRRKPPSGNGYEYKLYGAYDDVTAEDFLQVQIDTDYRHEWDTTAVELYVVDSDEKSNSDVVYWEMQWPRMFANRDYVYNRRYITENNIIIILSKSTTHPDCPPRTGKHRVTTYDSCMAIQPTKSLDEEGIEFALTYYEDPGVNIPSAVTSWVAMAAMPDFVEKLRVAAMNYSEYKEENDLTSYIPNIIDDETKTDYPISNLNNQPDNLETTSQTTPISEELNILSETKGSINAEISTNNEINNNSSSPNTDNNISDNDQVKLETDLLTKQQLSQNVDSDVNINSSSRSYWRYIHPYYYLG